MSRKQHVQLKSTDLLADVHQIVEMLDDWQPILARDANPAKDQLHDLESHLLAFKIVHAKVAEAVRREEIKRANFQKWSKSIWLKMPYRFSKL
jgi:hypothetical protein